MRAVTVKAAARRDEELHVLLVWAHLAAVLAALAALAMGSCWAWACAAERNAEPEGPVAGTAGLLVAGYGSVRPLELLPDEEIEMRSGMDDWMCVRLPMSKPSRSTNTAQKRRRLVKSGSRGRSVLGRSSL